MKTATTPTRRRNGTSGTGKCSRISRRAPSVPYSRLSSRLPYPCGTSGRDRCGRDLRSLDRLELRLVVHDLAAQGLELGEYYRFRDVECRQLTHDAGRVGWRDPDHHQMMSKGIVLE